MTNDYKDKVRLCLLNLRASLSLDRFFYLRFGGRGNKTGVLRL